jgi:hemerythrin-like domain-containing protein
MLDNGPETATKMLRDEHVLILRVVDALEETFGPPGSAIDAAGYDVIEQCASFFRLYADACHHGKEEDLLFPELQERGLPRDDGPIAVMLEEHRRGRAFVERMVAAVAGARSGQEAAQRELRIAADGYIDLIRGHIDKEDNVLFNMADAMVVGDACRRLCGDYATVCARRFDGHTIEDLERLASEVTTG